MNKQLNKNVNYNDLDLRSSQQLRENLMGSSNAKTDQLSYKNLNQIQLENIDKSLEDDTFVENRNMKLNSKT